MSNRNSKTGPSSAPYSPDSSSAAIIGRRLGATCYWLFLIFVLSAGAYSIIPQAFGTQVLEDKADSKKKGCEQTVRALKAELFDKADQFIVDYQAEKMHKWLRYWDQRFRAMTKKCGSLEASQVDLKTLRDRLESMVAYCGKNSCQQNLDMKAP